MACSGCEQRREALKRAAEAVARGDHAAAKAEMEFVTRTATEDLRALVRKTMGPLMPPHIPKSHQQRNKPAK